MPIPSQPMQECSGGVTTSAWSPERTVKRHECERTQVNMRSKDSLNLPELKGKKCLIKSEHDNKIDHDSIADASLSGQLSIGEVVKPGETSGS